MSDTSKIDDGGAAFPQLAPVPGLSRRDYFAAAALTGAMTTATGLGTMNREERRRLLDETAALIFEMADAMIAASKTGGPEHG
jgi:hypothetical protein